MGQKLYHKNIGEVEFEGATWQDGPHHIGRLKNGAWCHITGLPIQNKQEIRQAITGADPHSRQAREEAENWFDHRHDDEQASGRSIMFRRGDNVPIFDDGEVVEDSADLIQFFKAGPLLDAALSTFYANRNAQAQADAAAEKKATRTNLAKATEKKVTTKPAGTRGKAKSKGLAPSPRAARITPSPALAEAPTQITT